MTARASQGRGPPRATSHTAHPRSAPSASPLSTHVPAGHGKRGGIPVAVVLPSPAAAVPRPALRMRIARPPRPRPLAGVPAGRAGNAPSFWMTGVALLRAQGAGRGQPRHRPRGGCGDQQGDGDRDRDHPQHLGRRDGAGGQARLADKQRPGPVAADDAEGMPAARAATVTAPDWLRETASRSRRVMPSTLSTA